MRLAPWLAGAGAWLALAAITATQNYVFLAWAGRPIDAWTAIWRELIMFGAWAALTPPVVLAARWIRRRGRRALLLHAPILIPLGEIECIEASGKHVSIHVVGPQAASHVARDTLAALEQRLDPERFVRVHRSAIVNLDHVRLIRPWFAGDQHLTLTSGRALTTGRGYRERLLARVRR